MNVQNRKNKDGFTIIEVVLELAIAALIFLMVFIALPALQRNQRDTQRKSDAGRVASQIAQWQSSHRGAIPAVTPTNEFTATFIPQYMQAGGGQFNDPNGNNYAVQITTTAIAANLASNSTTGAILRYNPGTQCNNDPAGVPTGSTARKFSVTVQLESGIAYCVDNV